MSRKANPATIGGFVLVAVALLVAGVLLFSRGSLFADTSRHVVFFDGSVRGLSIGSPVLFQGVRVGQVVNISLEIDGTSLDIDLPVVIEMEDTRFGVIGTIDRRWHDATAEDVIDALVEKGLRAQLQIQSLVTGQLGIQLDFLPDRPKVYRMPETSQFRDLHEIPAVPSDMERVARRAQEFIEELQDFPVAELGRQIMDTLAAVEGLAESTQLTGAIDAARSLMESPQIPEMLASIDRAARQADLAMSHVGRLADGPAQDVLAEATGALGELRGALTEVQGAMASTRQALDRDSDVRIRINLLMEELTRTARSVRQLTEMLQERPESMIRGKRESP
jgi:paraquat-inducible protein B